MGFWLIQRHRGNVLFLFLVVAALCLGVAFLYFWCTFGKIRPVRVPARAIVVMKNYSPAADMEYRQKFRQQNGPNGRACREDVSRFLRQANGGLYRKYEDLDARYYQCIQRILDAIEELDQDPVPPQFIAAHTSLFRSYMVLLESLELIKQGYYSEGRDRSEKYAQARKRLTQGCELSVKGEEGIRARLKAKFQ